MCTPDCSDEPNTVAHGEWTCDNDLEWNAENVCCICDACTDIPDGTDCTGDEGKLCLKVFRVRVCVMCVCLVCVCGCKTRIFLWLKEEENKKIEDILYVLTLAVCSCDTSAHNAK